MSIGGMPIWGFSGPEEQPSLEDHRRMLQRLRPQNQPAAPAPQQPPPVAAMKPAPTAGPENDPEPAASLAPTASAAARSGGPSLERPPGNFFAEADNRPALPKITYGGASPEAMGMLDAQEQMDVRRRAGLNGGIDPISFKKRLDELGGYGGVGMLHGHEDDPREQAIARASSAANDRRARMAESMLGNEMQLAMERGYGQFSGGPPEFGTGGGRLGNEREKLKIEQGKLDLANKQFADTKSLASKVDDLEKTMIVAGKSPAEIAVATQQLKESHEKRNPPMAKPGGPVSIKPPASGVADAQKELETLYPDEWGNIVATAEAAGIETKKSTNPSDVATKLVQAIQAKHPKVIEDNMPLVMKWADELTGGVGAAQRAVTANPFFATVLRAPTSSLPVGSQIGRGWDEFVRRLGGSVGPNPKYQAEDAITKFIRDQAAKQK